MSEYYLDENAVINENLILNENTVFNDDDDIIVLFNYLFGFDFTILGVDSYVKNIKPSTNLEKILQTRLTSYVKSIISLDASSIESKAEILSHIENIVTSSEVTREQQKELLSYIENILTSTSNSKIINEVISSYIQNLASEVNISKAQQKELIAYVEYIVTNCEVDRDKHTQVTTYLKDIESTVERMIERILSVDSIIAKLNTDVSVARAQSIDTLSFVDIINANIIKNNKNYSIVQAWVKAITTQAIKPNPRNISILLDILESQTELNIEEYLNLLSIIENSDDIDIQQQLNNLSIIENPSYMEVV